MKGQGLGVSPTAAVVLAADSDRPLSRDCGAVVRRGGIVPGPAGDQMGVAIDGDGGAALGSTASLALGGVMMSRRGPAPIG